MIDTAELQKRLKCRRFASKIYAFDSIESTNTYARALAADGAAEGTLVFAEEQTAGRGRLGRGWVANAGENLTFSLILRPTTPPDQINLLPLGIAVALARGVRRATSLPVYCKWPNDLLLHGKKCAGILMESALGPRGFEFIVVGIGVNVNQRTFPETLRARATSLALHAPHPFERISVFRAVLESLEQEYDTFASDGLTSIIPAWLELAPIIGKRVSAELQGETVHGTVTGITPDGGLQLHTDTGDLALFAGDVTILDMESYAPRN
jgi:BirA family transcriptional regulator, biotin operon repressor / biotin---[acetyl-CoA-carboxylase] ligase